METQSESRPVCLIGSPESSLKSYSRKFSFLVGSVINGRIVALLTHPLSEPFGDNPDEERVNYGVGDARDITESRTGQPGPRRLW